MSVINLEDDTDIWRDAKGSTSGKHAVGGWGAGVVECVSVGRVGKSAVRTQDQFCCIAEMLGDRPFWRIHDIRIDLPIAERKTF